jgi:hypothetical protein
VNETENRIEPESIARCGFPRHDFTRQSLERFPRFRDKIAQQIIHHRLSRVSFAGSDGRSLVNNRFTERDRVEI